MLRRTIAAGFCVALAACSPTPNPQVAVTPPPAPVVTPAPQPVPPPTAPFDPMAALIATSQGHFDSGERELKAGHLDKARESFDRSVEVLLESPYGARTDPPMRQPSARPIDPLNPYH